MERFTSLICLNAWKCKKLQSIPELGQLTKLTQLDVAGCIEILELPGVEHLNSLKRLVVWGCEKLQSIPGLVQLAKLTEVDVSGCREIQ